MYLKFQVILGSIILSMFSFPVYAESVIPQNLSSTVSCSEINNPDDVEVLGSWSNQDSNGEHDSGYGVTLLKIKGKQVGFIQNFNGGVGSGGFGYSMVNIKYQPKKFLSFGAFVEGSENPNEPWPYSLQIRRDSAILKVDEYRSETLNGSELPVLAPEAKKWVIEDFRRVLKCK